MSARSWTLASMVLVSGLVASGCSRGPTVPEGAARHLVLVTLDTTRRDRIGAYGGPEGLTPHLDALAERGVVFTDAVAQAVSTPPSHASILTGLNPPSHGLRTLWGQKLDPANVSIAELLAQRGFTTAAFVDALPLRVEMGLDQGFGVYEAELPKGAKERGVEVVNESVRQWLAGAESPPERMFLWVHYFAPHTPYFAPAEFRERLGVGDATKDSLVTPIDGNKRDSDTHQISEEDVERMRALYDAEIAYTDYAVGELMGILEEAGLLAEAAVAVVADHGEQLGDYGYYFGHWNVLDETACVPMILSHPDGRFAPGRPRRA